jgi:hypothetical protein
VTFVGPGAIQWMPSAMPKREHGDAVAVAIGFLLGTIAAVILALASRPAPRAMTAAPVEDAVLDVPVIAPAPPPQTRTAPYCDAAAQGTVRLPKDCAAGQVGIMVLPYGYVPRRDDE